MMQRSVAGCAPSRRPRALAVLLAVACALVLAALLAAPGAAWAAPSQGSQSTGTGTGGGTTAAEEANPAMTTGSTTEDLQTEETGALEAIISDLVNADISLNGSAVHFQGEVVASPVIADSEHTWITVSAGGEAIAVYMRNSDADDIEHFGSYNMTGDLLDITGTFYLDCETHEGDVDVHAIAVSVVAAGSERIHEPNMGILRIAMGLIVAGIVAGFVYWRLRERQR